MKLKLTNNSKRRNKLRAFFLKADHRPTEFYANVLKETEQRNGWKWHSDLEAKGVSTIG